MGECIIHHIFVYFVPLSLSSTRLADMYIQDGDQTKYVAPTLTPYESALASAKHAWDNFSRQDVKLESVATVAKEMAMDVVNGIATAGFEFIGLRALPGMDSVWVGGGGGGGGEEYGDEEEGAMEENGGAGNEASGWKPPMNAFEYYALGKYSGKPFVLDGRKMKEVRRQRHEKKERGKRECERAAGGGFGDMEIIGGVKVGREGGENALWGGVERHGIVGAVGDENLSGDDSLLVGSAEQNATDLLEAESGLFARPLKRETTAELVVEHIDERKSRKVSNDWQGFGEEEDGEFGDGKAGVREVVAKEGELALQEVCSLEDSCHIGYLARYNRLQAERRSRIRAGFQ